MGNVEKGKKLVGILCIVVIAISILVMVGTVVAGTFKMSAVVRLVLEVVIMYMAYTGKNWARILISVLALIGGGFSIIAGVLALILSPLGGIILVVMAITYLALGIMLLSNKDIKAYYNSCKLQ